MNSLCKDFSQELVPYVKIQTNAGHRNGCRCSYCQFQRPCRDKCDICEIQFNRQIIVLRMQSAQIFREIIYVNVFQVSDQTKRQFSPILAMTLMSVTSFHLVIQGKVSEIVKRVELPVRSVYP